MTAVQVHAEDSKVQEVLQQVICFLMQAIPNSTSFAAATFNMAAAAACGLLAECMQRGFLVTQTVNLWGPQLCR